MNTQCTEILEHLRKHGSISQAEAMQEYGIGRLASRVWDLRNQGYEIVTTIKYGINRYGNKIHFGEYVLKENQE